MVDDEFINVWIGQVASLIGCFNLKKLVSDMWIHSSSLDVLPIRSLEYLSVHCDSGPAPDFAAFRVHTLKCWSVQDWAEQALNDGLVHLAAFKLPMTVSCPESLEDVEIKELYGDEELTRIPVYPDSKALRWRRL